jgi:hypothetical protein
MNTEKCDSSICQGAFLPIVLIALSLLILFCWELKNTSKQRAALQSAIQRQEEGVKQSKAIQAGLEKLVLDLLGLAKSGDADAVAIVKKYNISQQPPATRSK